MGWEEEKGPFLCSCLITERKPRDEKTSSLEVHLRVKSTQRKADRKARPQLISFDNLDPAVPKAVYIWTFTVQEALNYLSGEIYIVIKNQVA